MKPENQEIERRGSKNIFRAKRIKKKASGMGRKRRQEIDRKINVNVLSLDINNTLYDYEEDEYSWGILLSNFYFIVFFFL